MQILEARSQRVNQTAAKEQMMIYNEEDASMPAVREEGAPIVADAAITLVVAIAAALVGWMSRVRCVLHTQVWEEVSLDQP
eukprot:6295192-Amphidinium_carterae.1